MHGGILQCAQATDEWEDSAEHDEYSHCGVFIVFHHLALHDLHHAYKTEDRLLRQRWA